MPTTPRSSTDDTDATARAETMLALAEHVGADLVAMNAARLRLEAHSRAYATAEDGLARNEAERLMALDVAELAAVYKLLATAVERGGEA